MRKLLALSIFAMTIGQASAATWVIGDNDGYGAGIPDNADHSFDTFKAGYDGRSAAEKTATNGAQYTDTYSTTHPGGFSPQTNTIATFKFTGLGSGWTQGSMWFDMADFQASTFGAVAVTFNGIAQNWAFNDGVPHTVIRFFDLDAAVLTSINSTGKLDVVIDRNDSGDFYGFDYALLSNRTGSAGIPEPGVLALFGLGLAGLAISRRHRKQ